MEHDGRHDVGRNDSGDAHRKRAVMPGEDAGLGLVEILVAMFLLAAISVAFLPLLVSSLQLTLRTSQNNTATQLLNEQLDLLASTDATCTALASFVTASVPDVTDERGTVYSVDRTAASCGSLTLPAVVRVEFGVTIDDGASREQTADSAFLVREAG